MGQWHYSLTTDTVTATLQIAERFYSLAQERCVCDLARYYRRSPHQPTPRKCEVEADVYVRKWSITHDSENESPHIKYNVFILRVYFRRTTTISAAAHAASQRRPAQ
jgi:hypothetical protein